MNTFDITEEQIIDCIIDCACNLNGENVNNIIKILVDFMQFKNNFKHNNIFENMKGE